MPLESMSIARKGNEKNPSGAARSPQGENSVGFYDIAFWSRRAQFRQSGNGHWQIYMQGNYLVSD